MKQYIIALIAVMGLLLVGGAFATEESAAAVQATQLQLHIDKAITVGANVIAKIEADQNTSANTAQLQEILDQLAAKRDAIDVNASTLESVKETREEVKDLVESFRETAKDLLDDEVKAQIKVKAESEFRAKYEQRIKKGEELQKQFNLKALERFAEQQQHLALNLSAGENVSLTPELEAKLASIRAKIEANQIAKDEIAKIRTEIKVNVESLKSQREELVAQIRQNVLEHRIEMLEQLIAQAQESNVSTTELVAAHAQLVGLLDVYASGNMSAAEFSKAAQTSYDLVAKAITSPELNRVRAQIRLESSDERVELRVENKAEMEAWREERKQILEELREGNKLRLEMREKLKDGKLESESRYEVRNADGSRLEVRQRLKDGVLETRIKERSADSEDESEDELEVEDESEDAAEVEDESDEESDDDSNDENN